LEIARRLRADNRVSKHNAEFDRVFKAIGKLQAVHSKARCIDINNIESVFAALETAELLGRLDEYSDGDDLLSAMRTVISSTVETALERARKQRKATSGPANPADPTGLKMPNYPPYDRFANLIRKNQDKAAVSIITFNYDKCLEVELEESDFKIDPWSQN
jgi:hypothetical protein